MVRSQWVGDGVGDRVVERAELGDFVDARILCLELLPGLVAAVERRDAGDVDIAGLPAVAIVLDRLLDGFGGLAPRFDHGGGAFR